MSIIDPPWEDQCGWHRMTRMTGPDCAVMCNLINIHTHTYTHTHDGIGEGGGEAKMCKKPHKGCRRDVGNGGDFGGKR